ncbi:MAG: flagellin/flagellar hook associated protein, partial [Xanthomonadaceae bacterium]|nr:flagellin/flagellar hook associated protein [Xanthomonadaceae bacterium]
VTSSGTAVTMDLSKISITGSDGVAKSLSGTASNVQDFADAVNAAGIPGVSAAVDGKGGVSFYSTAALTVKDSGSFDSTSVFATQATPQASVVGASFANGSTTAANNDNSSIALSGYLNSGDVKTVDSANALMSRVDVALKSVADFAAQLGAVQNRFQSTISTLAAQSTNLQASQSTIQDANFAAETANLSKAQVLQQAGISVLAQANSQPQQILKLLQ